MSTLRLRSNYIPWLFVAGFGVVVAVNSLMIWLAVGSFSGLYSNHARERGLYYNRVVAEQRSRDALHWQVDAKWLPDANRLQLVVTGANGKPLAGAQVSGELVRPVEKRPPFPIALSDLGEGQFTAHFDLPSRGNWDLDIVVEAQGQRFALTKRMFLR